MPYEIPQNLRYVEKIAFGLTFWQLFWLALFGGLAGIVFFKTPLNIFVKAVLSVVFMGFGVGFAFLGFFQHLGAYNDFRKGIKRAGFFDEKLREFIEVKKIENDAVYLRSGSLRAVLEVTPINFGILAPEEQKAIVSAYKDFLNSLDFPVQIVMRTTSLNIDEYLFDLRKKVFAINNPELEKQFESFKAFIQGFIQENSVKNRLFYLVVPYSPYSHTKPLQDSIASLQALFSRKKAKSSFQLNKEIALNQLNVRTSLCTEKLKRCGLFVKRLNNEELFALLAGFFDFWIHAENNYFYPLTMLGKSREAIASE